MNRDDKAHRFVVTWNAFLDGNRLAYLALVLAIGVDALVFMAGLFGAAAVKSPLSDVPSPKARSAEQLEAIVRNALGEERLENAELVLAAMRPARGDAEHRSEVDLAHYDAERAGRIRKVLVAGRSIGAVERASPDAHGERYLVRSELFEYLSVVANTARERASAPTDALVQIVGVALEPEPAGQCGDCAAPRRSRSTARHGFMAKVDLGAVGDEKDRRLVQTVLNAGMTRQRRAGHDRGRAPGRGLLARATGRPCQPRRLIWSTPICSRRCCSIAPASPAPSAAGNAASSRMRADLGARLQRRPAAGAPAGQRRRRQRSVSRVDEDMRRRFPGGPAEGAEVAERGTRRAGGGIRSDGPPRNSSASKGASDLAHRAGAHRAGKQAHAGRAARALAREHADDEQAWSCLSETRQRDCQIVPALMLLPSGTCSTT